MPDWFLARAQFERDRPIRLTIRRGDQHLQLQFVIAVPAWRSWNRVHSIGVIAFCLARLMLLSLAIFVGLSRPEQLSASCSPDVCNRSGSGGVSKFWMGRCTSSLACRDCDSYMPGLDLLSAGADRLVSIFVRAFLDPSFHNDGDGHWRSCRRLSLDSRWSPRHSQ
jgi:hypothetical protein